MKRIRAFALIMSIIMLMSIIAPFSVFAQTDELVTSGICGDNLIWSYNTSSGALTISGEGAMYNYRSKESVAPWRHLSVGIGSIKVEEGVTTIGNWAFAYCSNAKMIDLPETSLVKIGQSAFYRCSALEEIFIPDTVTQMAGSVFAYCSSLISVSISEKLTFIDSSVFAKCEKLKNIYYAGSASQWNAIDIHSSNVSRIEKAVLHFDKKVEINWTFDEQSGLLTVSGVGRIENCDPHKAPWSAHEKQIKEIVVEDGITGLGNYSFAYLSALVKVSLPETVTYIGSNVFYKCKTLESINIPSGVTKIYNATFYGCEKLNDVIIPIGVKNIYKNTFYGCNSLDKVYFNGTFSQWKRVEVLANNLPLENIEFLVESVSWTFDESTGTLTVSGDVRMDDYNSSTEPLAPWHEHCAEIKKVVIENGVQNVGDYAFYGCTALELVCIADSVTTIGTGAFYGCSALDNVIIPENVTTIGGGAFYNNASMTNITVPASVLSISSYAFSNCTALETVYYVGTREQYDAVSVAKGNEPYVNANVVFGHRIPEAEVTELGSKDVTYNGETYTLDNAYSFKATEEFETVNAISPFRYYHADFVVSFDNDVNDVVLAGYYKLYAEHVKSEDWVPLLIENVKAGEQIRVLNEKWFGSEGSVNYQELCVIEEFLCGVLDEDGDDENTTITVELRLYEVTENAPETSVETGEYITAGIYTYKFPEKVKIYSFDEESKTLTLFGNGEDVEQGKEPFAKYSADIKTVNITKDVTVIGANAFANAVNIENVIYDGTRAEWNKLNIGEGNENLLNANITFATYQGEMFQKKFTEDFLYRVGNNGAVKLGSLFEEKDGLEIDSKTVELSWKSLDGSANAAVTYTPNTTDWKESTLAFSGEGVIELSISDLSLETTLSLEVVTAKNVTAYSQLVNGNCVLLNDITMTSDGTYAMSNASLYGNGFTFDVTNGAYKGTGYATGNYVILMQGGSTIDNVKIVGKVYTEYGATSASDYNRAAVFSDGTNNVIVNSYISNTGSPVRVHSGSVEIKNSTLKGGTFANLDVRSGQVTLTDVTTINQVSDNDKGENGETVVGFGIVSYYEGVVSGTSITINGTLTQYNNFSKSDISYIKNSTAQAFLNTIFGTEYANYIYTDGSGEKWINTGIISMMETVGKDQIIDNRTSHDYIGQKAVAYGKTGYIHAPKAKAPVEMGEYKYVGSDYTEINKKPEFDYTSKNYEAKTDGSNRYCYYDEGQVNISIDSGDTFNWDPFIIKDTFKKGGAAIPYTVKMNGTSYTGAISFNADGEYIVEYTYTDGNNYRLNADGTIEKYSKTYTATVKIVVAVVLPNAKNATFDFNGNGYKQVKIGNDVYVMPNVSATSDTVASISVSGTTVYCPKVNVIMSDGKTTHSSGWYAYFPVFSGVVTITDYADKGLGDAVTYDASTQSLPSGLTAVNPTTAFKYSSATNADATPSVKNGILVYSSAKIEANRNEMNIDVEYIYTDNTGAIYHYYVRYYAPEQKYSPGCVTPETLVTLADGSQKQVQYLTGDETLLVWNHETGKLDTAPIAYIVDHGKEENETTVITLCFENGKQIEIIGEHVFYNMNTDKYVTLDKNAEDFIGQSFAMQGADGIYGAKLVEVKTETRTTAAYEVVTYKNVTCFTNGILSASAYLDKILNIFDIDENSKTYVNTAEDVEKYGLYTYADFEDLISEDAFELYNAKYLKIAVGKGYITWDDILSLIDIYFTAEVNPIN